MIVTTFGTRGSLPVAGRNFVRYGGNTTCLHIQSTCLPANMWLVIDAGTGILPLSQLGVERGIESVLLFFTHYHYDHVQGLLLSPWTYMKSLALHLCGPEENGMGPKQILEDVMRPPFHPVSADEVSSHITFKGVKHPAEIVCVVHPHGGFKLFPLRDIEAAEKTPAGQVVFSGNARYSLSECLVIRMFRSNHPERTISYRFEERPTGKVFVFLTDHENQDATPSKLRTHLSAADLLIMDSQYTRAEYQASKAGFGHGTPDFCVGVAYEVGAKALGLTHHDPCSGDDAVDAVLAEAREAAQRLSYYGQVTACKDFDSFTLE